MSQQLHTLLEEVHDLEQRIAERIQRKQGEREFEIVNGKAVFGAETRRRHRTLKKSLFRFLVESSRLKIVTAPVIYSLIIPLALLDCFVFVYQVICLPIYGIPQVKRRDFVVLDRHRLPYLNLIEKLNCVFCGYANGVVAMAREVASRTEQHWCPIKHARRAAGCNPRQCLYCEYGAAESFRQECARIRADFSDIQ